ncbi:MAG: exonuclease domain-containing protein [Cyclobacteriaceae bacterium]|nr:exonuclease domain-containing protein [Cyclobacteriaceae bacterium]
MYAIVDIETTGGYAANHRITEIAVFFHDGLQLLDHYQTLINPEQPIPEYITGLTGITDNMVANAPVFSEIAEKLYRMLEGKVFIAHNVHFDYSFIKREFELSGFEYNSKKLCTVRLSRKLIPGLKSYGLGNLCQSLGVTIKNRHRAAGDAEATAIIFHQLIQNDTKNVIQDILKKENKETKLPSNLPKEEFENLPNEPGIYYFLDKNNTVIYVGKAIDIKKRIEGHFTGSKGTWSNSNLLMLIHHINYELTGNELIALLFENDEILRIWPKYNKAQKSFSNSWGIYQYEDQKGYLRLSVNKVNKNQKPLVSLPTHSEVWQLLNSRIEEFKLCPKLSGIQNTAEFCYDYDSGKCDGACGGNVSSEEYNTRVNETIDSFTTNELSLVLFGSGRNEEETGFVILENGAYSGFGFVNKEDSIQSFSDLEKFIKPTKDNHYSRQVIFSFLLKPGYKTFLLAENSLIPYNFADYLGN